MLRAHANPLISSSCMPDDCCCLAQQAQVRTQLRLEALATKAVDKCLYTAYGIAADPAIAASTWGGVVTRQTHQSTPLRSSAAQQAFVHLAGDIEEALAQDSEAEAAPRLQVHAPLIDQLSRIHKEPPAEVRRP